MEIGANWDEKKVSEGAFFAAIRIKFLKFYVRLLWRQGRQQIHVMRLFRWMCEISRQDVFRAKERSWPYLAQTLFNHARHRDTIWIFHIRRVIQIQNPPRTSAYNLHVSIDTTPFLLEFTQKMGAQTNGRRQTFFSIHNSVINNFKSMLTQNMK